MKEKDTGLFGMNGLHKRRRGEKKGDEAEGFHVKAKVQTSSWHTKVTYFSRY